MGIKYEAEQRGGEKKNIYNNNFFDLFVIVSVVDYKYYELTKWMYI